MKLRNSCLLSKMLFVFSIGNFLAACDTNNDAELLAKSVRLEIQREQGTIIESVTITGDKIRLKAGESRQLSAQGIDSNGDTRDVTEEIVWASSDTNIATVNNSGLVTAISESTENQGIVTITGTTINDISGKGEISVSDISPLSLQVRQKESESDVVVTCVDTQFTSDVMYEDGYKAYDVSNNILWSLSQDNTASIDENGVLYTSNADSETIILTANLENIVNNFVVTTDARSLQSIDILNEDNTTNILTLSVGERLQVNSQVNIDDDNSTVSTVNIDNNVNWLLSDNDLAGVTMDGENKGTILALKPGVTMLTAECGGIESSVAIEVQGNATLEGLSINNGADSITVKSSELVELSIIASYEGSETKVNVTEFAKWSLNGSSLMSAELTFKGTEDAVYQLKNIANNTGEMLVSVTYDDKVAVVKIIVE